VAAAEWAAFGDIAQVLFDEAGRLHVLDASAKLVTVVDVDGSFVGTVGGPGDGPGELASPTGMARDGSGVLIVFDEARRSFVRYDSVGTFIGSVPLDPDVSAPAGPLGLHATGRVFSLFVDRVRAAGDDGPSRRELILYAVDPGSANEVVYGGWWPPTPEVRELTPEETGGMRVRLPPVVGFHPVLQSVALPDGRLAVVDSTDYRVRFVGGSPPTPAITRPLAPVRVDGALQDAERDRRVRLIRDAPPRLIRSDSDGARAEVAHDAGLRLELARIDGMGFHDLVPVIERLSADPLGRLWVQRSATAPDRPGPIDVVRPGGEYLGTLDADRLLMPDAFGPDGRIAYIVVDDYGATGVEVGRLMTPDEPVTPGG
jgi:hypothetical protein